MFYTNLQRLAWHGIIKSTKMLTLKQKLPLSKLLATKRAATVLFVAAVFTAGAIAIPQARADQFDAQIQALKQQNASSSADLAQLGAEAATLADEVGRLQEQINVLQGQINANEAKRDDLKKQITDAETELARQKGVLGQSIRAMYVEGKISTLEMLASSKDLSDFVDKQQYRSSVQDNIKKTLDKITALKIQLKDQQNQVEQLLSDQQNMQAQVSSQQARQSYLLSLNKQQQADINLQIRNNNSKVAELRRQQAAAIAAYNNSGKVQIVPSSGHGGYPDIWANARQDSMVDNWGMYNRECVSYTAFKVHMRYVTGDSTRDMPYWGGRGNANEWADNARSAGIPVDSNPTVGSIATMSIGYYGHAMYVEAVLGGGKVLVSQYNWSPGSYSEMIISTSSLQFIHF